MVEEYSVENDLATRCPEADEKKRKIYFTLCHHKWHSMVLYVCQFECLVPHFIIPLWELSLSVLKFLLILLQHIADTQKGRSDYQSFRMIPKWRL